MVLATPRHLAHTVQQRSACFAARGWPDHIHTLPRETKYFGDLQKVWMVNFRVRDLDRMAAQLQAAGIEIKVDPQSYPIGRFARLHDPEGNPIELWEPSKSRAAH